MSEKISGVVLSWNSERRFGIVQGNGRNFVAIVGELENMPHSQWGKLNPSFKHGKSRSPEYVSWMGMIARCTNPNDPYFSKYGGADPPVRVFPAWNCKAGRNGFVRFLEYMGPRPKEKTLGRYLHIGDYKPGNVIWQTKADQEAEAAGKVAMRAWHERRAIAQPVRWRWRQKFRSIQV